MEMSTIQPGVLELSSEQTSVAFEKRSLPREKRRERPKGLQRAQPGSKGEPLILACEWGDCQEVFDNMDIFVSHVTYHIQQSLPADEAVIVDMMASGQLSCEWRECGYMPSRDVLEIVRHVYFHAFHVKIKCVGLSVLQKNNMPHCALDSQSRNLIPELPERLQCGWHSCELFYDNPEYFYRHVSAHIEIYPEGNNIKEGCQCLWEGCDSSVKSKHKLKEHLRSHTQEKLVACPSCGGLFSNRTKFFDHVKRQTEIELQTYQCSHCNKRYPTERLLRDHMRHHVNHYKCPFCDMTCPSPSGLQSHIRYRHSDDRPYNCEVCELWFKTLTDMRRHMETHSQVAAFRCSWEGCDFSCRTYNTLSIHFNKTHQPVNETCPRYACHVCNAIFTRGGACTRHLKVKHKFKWPSGHTRFRYKVHSDGFLRLQTVRYESVELTEQVMSNSVGESGSPEGAQESNEESQDSSQGTEGNEHSTAGGSQELDESDAALSDKDMSYNLEMLGEVALKMPDQGRSLADVHSSPPAKRRKMNTGDNDDTDTSGTEVASHIPELQMEEVSEHTDEVSDCNIGTSQQGGTPGGAAHQILVQMSEGCVYHIEEHEEENLENDDDDEDDTSLSSCQNVIKSPASMPNLEALYSGLNGSNQDVSSVIKVSADDVKEQRHFPINRSPPRDSCAQENQDTSHIEELHRAAQEMGITISD